MTLIVSKKGKEARIVPRSEIEKEEYLQEYIHDNPEVIPIYDIKEDRKLLIVAREYETISGPIDAFAIDADGDLYIVETKLYKNPDKRRVVAQALDYGASLWRRSNDFDLFLERIENEIKKKFSLSFQEKASIHFDLDEDGFSHLIEGIRANLSSGTLRFVILMDQLDERLKDMIVFINQNSNFDIYAVELDQYKFEDYEIMIPRMFGVEVKKSLTSTHSAGARRMWDEASFLQQASERIDPDQVERLKDLIDFCKVNCDSISWGTGNQNGSFAPIIKSIHPTISPISIYTDGRIWVKYSWYPSSIGEEASKKLLDPFLQLMTGEAKKKYPPERIMDDVIWMDPGDLVGGYDGIKEYIKTIQS